MDEQTRQHLATADENRDFARSLTVMREADPAAIRWSTVAAFYAAVHYVNAYLWERLRIEPANHEERTRFVTVAADLRSVRRHYIRLLSISFDARYVAGYRLNQADAQTLIDTDLAAVRDAVLRALDMDAASPS